MQTCLEKRGMEARHEAEVRNDYNKYEEYSAEHIDAQADGDIQGKGTGHGHWLPDCSKANDTTNMIDYSNFDTTNKAGGKYDIEGRNGIGGRQRQESRQLYTKENQYGVELVDTSANIRDGQIYFAQMEHKG